MDLLKKARGLRNTYHEEEAVSVYLEYAQQNPEDASRALSEAAECYLRINVLEEPVDLGFAKLISQGDRENAERFFRRALDIDPTNVRALAGLAAVLKPNDPERRILLERQLEQGDNVVAMLELGDFLRTHEKNADAAYVWYSRAVDRKPSDKSAYLKLQHLCRKMGRLGEVETWKRKWKEQMEPFRPKRSLRDKPVEVAVGSDGWVTCPQCGFRFKPDNDFAFREGRHRRCGQRLALTEA